MSKRWVRGLILAGILCVALGLRVWGMSFGLPYNYHFDERFYVNTALNLGNGILNNPPYNPTGFSNLLFPQYAGYYVIGKAMGVFASPAGFEAAYRSDPTVFYLVARLIIAVLGAATVLAVYLLGEAVTDPQVGLFAAGLLAVTFLHVRDSHYAVPDVAMTLFVTLAVGLAAFGMRREYRRYIYLAGFAGGVAVAMKWTALPVALPVCWAAVRVGSVSSQGFLGRYLNRTVILAVLSLALGFALLSPQVLINPAPYFGTVKALDQDAHEDAAVEGRVLVLDKPSFYARTLLYGTGGAMLALAAAGTFSQLVRCARSDRRMGVLLFSFPAAYGALILLTGYYFARYLLPLLPFIVLFAAELIATVLDRVRRTEVQRALGTALVVAAIGQPLAQSVWHDVLLTRTDTRTLAKAWIEETIQAGSKIAVDWPIHGPPLSTPEWAVPYSKRAYDVHVVGGLGLSDHPLDWYREQEFDYLVSSSFVYQWFSDGSSPMRSAFYDSLSSEFSLVQEFRSYRGEDELPYIGDEIYGPAVGLWRRVHPGPTIKIYRVQ